jgi:hypothetical protein
MKAKHMDVACYSILLVAVAIVGIELTSPASVSGQEEEESFITSIAQDGQNAQDGTQLATPASASGQEEEESTITPLAQADQNAQNGPAVFPKIASVTDKSEVGADVTDEKQVSSGDDFDKDTDTSAGKGTDFANGDVGVRGADGIGRDGVDGADGIGRDGVDGATESVDGVEGVDSFAIQLEASIP